MKVESLRKAYGNALVALGDKDNRIVALEADLGKSTMSIAFGKKYPDRYFQMGIAEQNMISTAAGLALTGKIPFASSFAVFSSGRPYDQIRSRFRICMSSSAVLQPVYQITATEKRIKASTIWRSCAFFRT